MTPFQHQVKNGANRDDAPDVSRRLQSGFLPVICARCRDLALAEKKGIPLCATCLLNDMENDMRPIETAVAGIKPLQYLTPQRQLFIEKSM
jgi:hypothetical protein